jgi:UPF0716 family protein affecting phage T7 exclusion
MRMFAKLLLLFIGLPLLEIAILVKLGTIIGFSLLIPWIRSRFKRWLQQKFVNMVQSGQTRISFHSQTSSYLIARKARFWTLCDLKK